MKKKIIIREGNTGILYIQNESGDKEKFIPDCDLKESNRLLQEFYKLQAKDGKSIKDSFWEDGINWFPTIIALLHWQIIYIYVKYKHFINKYPVHEYRYVFHNSGRLSEFIKMFLAYNTRVQKKIFINTACVKPVVEYLKSLVKCMVATIHNRSVFKHYPQAAVLFYKCGVTDDFRTSYLIKTLADMNIQYIELSGLKIKQLIFSLFLLRPSPNLLFAQKKQFINYKSFNIPENIEPMLKQVFMLAVLLIQDRIVSFKTTYYFFRKQFKFAPFKLLYGIDDTNSIHPIIYACKANGIKTMGHQHGANYSPWDAPYCLTGFKSGEYQWFDKILVWGEWWREHILSHSTCFSSKQIQVGTHMRHLIKHQKNIDGIKTGTMNILIPYEFLADTYTIGRYICALQELGYTIYFKWRPDERLDDELDAYCLPEENRKKLIVVKEITDELMSKIDIVAGTYSTLIFELFPYLKETWIFETKFIFWDCLVEKGIANKIRLNHLKEDIGKSYNRIDKTTAEKLFAQESLKEVLERELKELLIL